MLYVDGEDAVIVEVCAGDQGRVVDPEELLQYLVFKHRAEDKLVVKRRREDRQEVQGLGECLGSHRLAKLCARAEESGVHDEIACVFFELPRDGNRCYFSVPSLLAALGFERHGKRLASMVCKQVQAWERMAEAFELHGVLLSAHYNKGLVTLNEPAEDRPLREKSLSAATLSLLMLACSGFCCKQSGGLAKESDSAACRNLLRRLRRTPHELEGFELQVSTSPDAKRHASGLLQGDHVVALKISREGTIDLADFNRLQDVRGSLARSWVRSILARFPEGMPTLLEFSRWLVTDACRRDRRKLLPTQFFWELGSAFDAFAARSLAGSPLGAKVSFEHTDQDHIRDRYVAAYHFTITDVVRALGPKFLSGAVDKSSVASYNLMKGAYVLPNSQAFWCAPQVVIANFWGGRSRLTLQCPVREKSIG